MRRVSDNFSSFTGTKMRTTACAAAAVAVVPAAAGSAIPPASLYPLRPHPLHGGIVESLARLFFVQSDVHIHRGTHPFTRPNCPGLCDYATHE